MPLAEAQSILACSYINAANFHQVRLRSYRGSEKDEDILEHVFIKRQQSNFKEGLANFDKEEAVVQVDFEIQYEIQTAHQENITHFTVAVWTK